MPGFFCFCPSSWICAEMTVSRSANLGGMEPSDELNSRRRCSWRPLRAVDRHGTQPAPGALPGSTWNRSSRRRGGWHPSAIGGDPTRGIGVLNNEAYIGRTIWNRSKWIKYPDTGKRRCVQRARSE